MLLSECVTISDQGYSLRVIHVHVGEGIARARPSAGRGIGIWFSCVIRPLPPRLFWVRVDESDCRGLSNVCFDLHRRSSLRLGAVRTLDDAAVQAVQRLAEESPATASLPSLTACSTYRR